MAAWLCYNELWAVARQRRPCSVIFLSGTACHAEETVLSDRFAGSARPRELPEGEKQFARHASEGRDSGRVLMLSALHCIYAAPMPAGEREAGVFGWKVCRAV